MADAETIAVYDRKAAEYADLTDGAMERDPRLSAFIVAMPEGGHVLDLGCGPGTSARIMAVAGIRVDAVDASAEMVAMASRHAGVTARQAEFADIDGQDCYDGIWASFSLLHAPRAALPHHLRALHKALKPGGSFVIAVKTGTGETRDEIGRLYTYYEEDTLIRLLQDHGFTPIEITRGRDRGLSGAPADWVSVLTHG